MENLDKSKNTKKTNWKRLMLIICGLLLTPLLIAWYLVTQPILFNFSTQVVLLNSASLNKEINTERLKKHVVTLSETFHPRNDMSLDNLNSCADYIAEHLRKAGGDVRFQEYTVNEREYKNVIAIFGAKSKEHIVIGAHYDSCGETPGADDNASGVAGLLELGYILQKYPPSATIELVAFTLEEPPNFASTTMGSYVHAKKAHEDKIKIPLMISLEMIGYFTDEEIQEYPLAALKLIYPTKGNYISVVSHFGNTKITREFKSAMRKATDLPVYSINAPRTLPGVDFSDHRNYWDYDIPAIMITDTAFYRNTEYHQKGDTADRLDYEKMGKVTIGVYNAITSFIKKNGQ